MTRFRFTTILTLLVSAAIGQAGPLDTWTLRSPSLTDKPLYGIAYGNDQFVAVVWDGTVLTSADGVNWVQGQTGTTNYLRGIAYGDGQFIAVGTGGAIVSSADGTNWAQRQSGTTAPLYDAVYGNGHFVAVGGGLSGTDALVVILTSADSTNWVRQLPGGGKWDFLHHIAYGKGQFVAAGSHSDYVGGGWPIMLTSADATNWFRVQTVPTNGVSGIAYGNGQFVGVGSAIVVGSGTLADTIVTSADGVNWVQRQSGTTNGLSGIAYGSGQFVAVGGWQDNATGLELSGTIVTSADGLNWVERPSGTTNLLFAAVYGNGHFLAVGDNGTILESGSISTLALTPKTSSGPFSLSLEGPAGLTYTLQSSTDLISWQTVTNITSVQPTTVIFDALPTAPERVFYRAYSQ